MQLYFDYCIVFRLILEINSSVQLSFVKLNEVMEYSMSEHDTIGNASSISKKKSSHGRLRNFMAKIRRQSYETSPDCNCKRQWFEQVGDAGKQEIVERMIDMNSNEINLHLSSLITILPIQRRRPRKNESEACTKMQHIHTSIVPCKAAFTSLHRIGRGC